MNWPLLFAGLFAYALAGILPTGAAIAARVISAVLFGVGLVLTLVALA